MSDFKFAAHSDVFAGLGGMEFRSTIDETDSTSVDFKFAPNSDYFSTRSLEATPTIDSSTGGAFKFAPRTRGTLFAGLDDMAPAPAREFYFAKEMDLRGEDAPVFRKSAREKYSIGETVRWLKGGKRFVITKALYLANGLWLIHGDKLDSAGTIMGVFAQSELARLPA